MELITCYSNGWADGQTGTRVDEQAGRLCETRRTGG